MWLRVFGVGLSDLVNPKTTLLGKGVGGLSKYVVIRPIRLLSALKGILIGVMILTICKSLK